MRLKDGVRQSLDEGDGKCKCLLSCKKARGVALASKAVGACDFPSVAEGAGGTMASKPDEILGLFSGEEGSFHGTNEGLGEGPA